MHSSGVSSSPMPSSCIRAPQLSALPILPQSSSDSMGIACHAARAKPLPTFSMSTRLASAAPPQLFSHAIAKALSSLLSAAKSIDASKPATASARPKTFSQAKASFFAKANHPQSSGLLGQAPNSHRDNSHSLLLRSRSVSASSWRALSSLLSKTLTHSSSSSKSSSKSSRS